MNPRTLERCEQARSKPNDQTAALIWLVRKYPDTLERLESLEHSRLSTRIRNQLDRTWAVRSAGDTSGRAQWRAKRARADSFAARVASQPRIFVIGSEDAIG